jgi:hypothetical protein
MRVGVIFPGAVVAVLGDRLVWRQLLQPVVIVLVQAAFVVVDEHAGGDMLRVYKHLHPLHVSPQSRLFQRMPLSLKDTFCAIMGIRNQLGKEQDRMGYPPSPLAADSGLYLYYATRVCGGERLRRRNTVSIHSPMRGSPAASAASGRYAIAC